VPSALVTGASRGIGRAVASRLAERGWEVYAGVRRREDADALNADQSRISPVILDVTDEQQIAALDGVLPEDLDAVINNAGIVVDGPVEAISPAELRRQLEVNVVAQITVTQAVLPRLRRSRGRVLFVSSVSGRAVTPWLGAYSASKFALEALADALRIELRPWGIKVILIEPGNTDTDLWRSADKQLEETAAGFEEEHRRLYAGHIEGMRRLTPVMQRTAVPVERVVDAVERALSDRRPRARYPVGAATKAQVALSAASPTRINDAVLARVAGIKRR
jgi:NAD(P)-dependent dehydrogenase (short-subunit alcohol dehydrogenase family)